MGLIRYKLGDLLDLIDDRNTDAVYSLDNLRGISIQKTFIDTKANMDGVSLSPYKIVKPNDFAYVTVTSRNGDKITLAHNDTKNTYIVSSSYVVFRVSQLELISPDYLFMLFNRSEFDRFARFNSWGSARETFSWEDLCDVEVELPSYEIQQKYVAIYDAMVESQRCYECSLENLKLACEASLEKLIQEYDAQPLRTYIATVDERNGNQLGLGSVKGISTNKEFIETKAKMAGVSLANYKVVRNNQFAYVADTSRRGEKISLALNTTPNAYLVSSITTTFSTDEKRLIPGYLNLFFSRSEFDRYARFNSWGSARETFDWSEMEDVCIPIPPIDIQQSIADMHAVYLARKAINERLKRQIKDLCPILIRGSIEEAERQ